MRSKIEGVLIRRGLSQTDLYDLIESAGYKPIGKDRINRIVSGVHTNYNLNTLLIFCEVLSITPNDIVDYESTFKADI